MQFINTLIVLALVVASFALIVAVPVLYASSEDSLRSNRLILLGSAVWVALERAGIKSNLGWSYGLEALEIGCLMRALPSA